MPITCTPRALGAALLLACSLSAWAGPGHDHGAAPAVAAGQSLPVVTAVSEAFELVGRLHQDELAILIDRAESNEPVLAASLTVEVDGRSIAAPFDADRGGYFLSEPAALARLQQVGSKPLTFTLIAGDDSDLLTGELDVHEQPVVAADRHGWPESARWTGAAFAGLALLGLAVRRFHFSRNQRPGGAA